MYDRSEIPSVSRRRLASAIWCVSAASGGGRESNPPGSFRPHTGFEDRGAHQAP